MDLSAIIQYENTARMYVQKKVLKLEEQKQFIHNWFFEQWKYYDKSKITMYLKMYKKFLHLL